MTLIIRKIVGLLFVKFKKLVYGRRSDGRHFIDFDNPADFPLVFDDPNGNVCTLNDISLSGKKILKVSDVYQYDNVANEKFFLLYNSTRIHKNTRHHTPTEKTIIGRQVSTIQYVELWESFLAASKIPSPWRNEGFYYSCFVLEENRWSSPSWIWTNGAIGRYFSRNGKSDELKKLADNFLKKQLEFGGWVVRYDFKGIDCRLSQTVAPNDSAYICANTILPAFVSTNNEIYLKSAQKCAEWIMKHGHDEFLVRIGYELETKTWDTTANIVDIGFTSDLFVKLFQLTNDERYIEFASKFLKKYLSIFYMGGGRLSTAVDGGLNRRGTAVFTRGHAWALEGLIPFYAVTGDEEIMRITDEIVNLLIELQSSDGSWLHLYRPGPFKLLSGPDCKGTPVIAHALARWAGFNPSMKDNIQKTVSRAIDWSKCNTATNGIGKGGIFSWNSEGALAGRDLTSAACVYSNAYLLEIVRNSNELSRGTLDFSGLLKEMV